MRPGAGRSPRALVEMGSSEHIVRLGFLIGLITAIRSPGAIALIGGIAGVTGGVLGALAGGWATYKIETQRQSFQRRRDLRAELRERERDLAGVRGTARVWGTKLDDLRHLAHSYCNNPEYPPWWLDEHDVETSMSVDDMKAVAAELSRAEWELIDVALSAIRSVQGARVVYWQENEELLPGSLDEDDQRRVDNALSRLDEAMTVLADLSERSPRLSRFGEDLIT